MTEEHKCGACGSLFESREALQAHAKADHRSAAEQFSCGSCGGTFGSQEEARAHAKSMHAPAQA